MFSIQKYFKTNCYKLNANIILELNEEGNGEIFSLISEKMRSHFVVKIYKHCKYSLYYINLNSKLNGLCFDLSIRKNVKDRTLLTLEFCKLISIRYETVNFLNAFNIFQKRLIDNYKKLGYPILEIKYDFFDVFPGFKKTYQDKKPLVFPVINLFAFYTWFFTIDNKNIENYTLNSVFYLLYNHKTNLIQIRETSPMRYKMEEILRLNIDCDIITDWRAPNSEEKELEKLFSHRDTGGFWYHFTLNDLHIIKNRIQRYSNIKKSTYNYKKVI